MSLKAFHVVFIGASAMLALFVAAWCLDMLPGDSGTTHVLAGVFALLAGAALVAYEVWFVKKKMGSLP